MDQKMWDKGLGIRKAVLGEAYVTNAMKNVDSFNAPFQDLLNEYCWGSVWGREELPRKTRSMLNIAMISKNRCRFSDRIMLKRGRSAGKLRGLSVSVTPSCYATIGVG